MESKKHKFNFLLYLFIPVLLLSCSGKKVLFINDPYFESFAAYSDSFYKFKKSVSFLKNGYLVEFVDPSDSDNLYDSVNELLLSGEYDALISFYLSYHSLNIPENLPVVLIGGSEELLYPALSHVVSSDIQALEEVSAELWRLWEQEGIIPLTVFWDNPPSVEQKRNALLKHWNNENREILLDNWLDLDINTANAEKKLEDYFRKYDFENSKYVVFAYCAPLYKEFFRTVPDSPDLKFIMAMPDNPVLPSGTYALIREDYSGLISAAVKSLRAYSPGKIIKVENNFIKK